MTPSALRADIYYIRRPFSPSIREVSLITTRISCDMQVKYLHVNPRATNIVYEYDTIILKTYNVDKIKRIFFSASMCMERAVC